jgi:hypothetical protein
MSDLLDSALLESIQILFSSIRMLYLISVVRLEDSWMFLLSVEFDECVALACPNDDTALCCHLAYGEYELGGGCQPLYHASWGIWRLTFSTFCDLPSKER